MAMHVLKVAFLFSSCTLAFAASTPKAQHLTYVVNRGEYVEIPLTGYDVDGDILTAHITQLPLQGNLYQLTQVYSDYGYKPEYEENTKLTSPNTEVVDKKRRIIYTAPKTTAVLGQWGSFKYILRDSQGLTSAEGIVHLVPSNEMVLVGSDFSRDSEGWGIRENGKGGVGISHERTSHGNSLNYFIYSTDDELHIDSSTGDDIRHWYFVAPSKFLGSFSSAYGGYFKFSIGAFSGNFATNSLNSRRDLVVLECTTCNVNRGMRFVARNMQFDGTVKEFSLKLDENGGWLKDPKNTLKPWTTPTQCEMVEMLHSLSAVHILGDFTKWYESVGIDNIRLTAGSKNGPPVNCLCTHPGTQC